MPAAAWRLDLEHYTKTGGLKALLSDHADAVMRQAEQAAAGAETGRVVEDIFRALTDINAQGQGLRRPRTLAQLVAVTGADEATIRTVLDAFRAESASLVRPYGTEPIERQTLIDISHEALIRGWQRIADTRDGWLAREFRNGLVWRALLVQADSFERDANNVLAPTTTDEREKWMKRRSAAWASRYGGGWDRVQSLMRASAAARDRARADQLAARRFEEAARLRDQRLRFFQRGGAVLLLLLVATSYFAWVARRDRAQALRAVAQARVEQAEALRQFESANAARIRTEQLAAQANRSAAELIEVGKYVRRPSAGGPERAATVWAEQIEQVAQQLSNVAGAAPYTSGPGPRAYLHITSDEYRPAARAFEKALEGTAVNGARVVVPGIELVSGAPPRSVVRCFQADECAGEGRALVAVVNNLLAAPQFELQDLSARYSTSRNVRPRHYEIWFAPGPITLR